MDESFDLLLAPHPDDLVYSAFTALTDESRSRLCITFFNLSRFTRLGLLPAILVTPVRTLEDRFVMKRLGVNVSYLFLRDSSARSSPIVNLERMSHLPRTPPDRVFLPLGVGSHPDHLSVRELGLLYQSGLRTKPELWFYEDFPYSARLPGLEEEETQILRGLYPRCGKLATICKPMSDSSLQRKILFSNLYLSQVRKGELLVSHASWIGRSCSSKYAERFHCTTTTSLV